MFNLIETAFAASGDAATGGMGSTFIMLIVMVALPTIYSYCLYRKQRSKEKE